MLSIPVDRISLYSSRDRPLKLVSLGRGYWSHGAEGKREGGERRLVLQHNPGLDDPGQKPRSNCSSQATGVWRPEGEAQRHLEAKPVQSGEAAVT